MIFLLIWFIFEFLIEHRYGQKRVMFRFMNMNSLNHMMVTLVFDESKQAFFRALLMFAIHEFALLPTS